jgi:hypothetical protein
VSRRRRLLQNVAALAPAAAAAVVFVGTVALDFTGTGSQNLDFSSLSPLENDVVLVTMFDFQAGAYSPTATANGSGVALTILTPPNNDSNHYWNGTTSGSNRVTHFTKKLTSADASTGTIACAGTGKTASGAARVYLFRNCTAAATSSSNSVYNATNTPNVNVPGFTATGSTKAAVMLLIGRGNVTTTLCPNVPDGTITGWTTGHNLGTSFDGGMTMLYKTNYTTVASVTVSQTTTGSQVHLNIFNGVMFELT